MILHIFCIITLAMICFNAAIRFLHAMPAALALAAALTLALPAPGVALTHYWGRHPDKERLVVVFPDTIPSYNVKRTGNREISLILPAGYWQQDSKPQPGIFNTATLLQDVNVTPEGLQILLKTNAFGYIQFPLRDRGKLVIDIFKDPIGAKWTPENKNAKAQAVAPAKKTVKPAAAPKPEKEPKPATAAPQTRQPVKQETAAANSEPAVEQPQPETAQTVSPKEPASSEIPAQDSVEQAQGGQSMPEPGAAVAPSKESLPAQTASQSQTPAAKPQQPEPQGAAEQAQAQGDPAAQTPSPQRQGGESLETLKEQFEQVRSKPTARKNQSAAKAQPSKSDSQSFFSVPYSYRAPIRQHGPEGDTPSKGSGSDRGAGGNVPGDQSSSLQAPPKGLLRFLDEALSVPPAYAAELQAQPDETADSEGGNAASVSGGNGEDTPAAPSALAPAEEAGEAEAEGFTVRARMAPPETTTPLPVPTASSMTAGQGREEAQLPQPGVEQTTPAASAPEPSPEAEAVPQEEAEAAQEAQPSPQPQEQAATQEQPAAMQPDAGTSPEQTTAEGEPDPNAPPDFEEVILAGRAALANEDYQNALDVFEGVRNHPLLPDEMRLDVLYNYADALYAVSKNNMRENYSKLTSAYTEAMNAGIDSPRVPEALFKLGVLNLKVNSPDQARAYFNILRKRYPDDDRVPLINYYWGEYYYDHKDYQKAADEFQYIVQKYPDNRFVREASVGLARSLNKLGYVDQAQEIVEYIEKRWPRYYVEYPPLLKLFGDVHYKAGLLDKAKLNYWTYYNMDPEAEGADLLLARLGDIYLELGDMETARELYEMAVEKFPDREGGLIAQMRLAEQGVYDTPTMEDMFSVFDKPYTMKPVEVYKSIVEQYPNSDLAPLAQLKLAMWYLWNDKLRDSLDAASEFEKKFPGNELLESARNVALSAFDKLTDRYVREQNYVPLVEVWDNSPILQAQQDDLAPETRLGLANALWKTGSPLMARNMLDPFFMGPAMPRHSENALMLGMAICLDDRDWDCLVDLARRTELWDISPRVREEMDYNLALAYENLDQPEKSAPLWAKLAGREDIDITQMAYINYFLAHKARDDGDYKEAYTLAQNSLGTFLEDRKDEQKIKDLLALMMDITRKTGRTREALKWAIEYSRYINKNDPEWPALRYQMAQLYRELADVQKWQAILEELVEDKPNSLYGRMAASDLKTRKLEENVREFAPSIGGI